MIQSLIHLFSHRFQFAISCVLPNIGSNQILVQTKDEVKMESYYVLLHLKAANQLFNQITIHNSWFQIPLAVYDNTAIIQYFPDDQNPEKKNILEYDFSNGKINWERSDVDFVVKDERGVVLRDSKIYYLLNNQFELSEISKSSIQFVEDEHYNYPHFFDQAEPEFIDIATIIEKTSAIKCQLGVEYLEYKQNILVSYYTIDGIKFSNFLLVLDLLGRVVFHQKINDDMKGLGRDTFFIFADKLIFVSNKTTLNTYAF